MKILIIGGDKRTLEIIKDLQYTNDVDVIGFKTLGLDTIDINTINKKKYDSIIFPISGIQDDYSVNCPFNDTNINVNGINFDITEKCMIFCGPFTDKLKELFGKHCINLMNFDDVSIENSIPTVEGVIAYIIQDTEYTINNSNITVLGYGRVGKTLVNYLIKLGANVNVGVIKISDYIDLFYKHIKSFYTLNMEENIDNSDIIINTVPKLLLNKSGLDSIRKDTYIVDISSSPYGVDFEYAKSKNIKYAILPGLPGKVAPKTAGKILAKKINIIMKEGI